MATSLLIGSHSCTNLSELTQLWKPTRRRQSVSTTISRKFHHMSFPLLHETHCLSHHAVNVASISSSSSHSTTPVSAKLYISGLSFRTTEESLRNAFIQFGELVEVNLVMDRIANRPRGFAFISYATEDASKKAIQGMHGKFLDGRVIFVEVAKPKSEIRKNSLISRE